MVILISTRRTSSCNFEPYCYLNLINKNIILWNSKINAYLYLKYIEKENKYASTICFKYIEKNFLSFYGQYNNFINKYIKAIENELLKKRVKYVYMLINFDIKSSNIFLICNDGIELVLIIYIYCYGKLYITY